MLNVVMLNVIMLNVMVLLVVRPTLTHKHDKAAKARRGRTLYSLFVLRISGKEKFCYDHCLTFWPHLDRYYAKICVSYS